jgi:HK97 family phage portal protein
MIRPRAEAWGPDDDRWYNPGGSYYGGVPLPDMVGGSENAMRLITVQNCVRVRAYTISQLPCHVMEKKGKERIQATDFYLYEKLHDQPNDWMTASEFWGMAEAHVCLRGNFIAYKLGIENRPIQQLIPLKTDAVSKIEQNDDYSLSYHIRFKSGEIREIPGSKFLHLRGLTLDGINGVNPIEYARETISNGASSNTFLSNFFNKGLHPGAIFKHKLPLNAPAHANKKAELKKKYQGLGKSWEMMLIDEGMEVEFPTVKLVDAQFLEQMKMNEAQIAGLFRVPLMLIQSGSNVPTYASSEQFMISYAIYGVTPDCVNYEKAVNRDLMTKDERKKYYTKFNINSLMRGSMAERSKYYQTMVNTEILSPDECRDLEDLSPRPDGKGGEYRTRTSTVKESDSSNDDSKQENKDET